MRRGSSSVSGTPKEPNAHQSSSFLTPAGALKRLEAVSWHRIYFPGVGRGCCSSRGTYKGTLSAPERSGWAAAISNPLCRTVLAGAGGRRQHGNPDKRLRREWRPRKAVVTAVSCRGSISGEQRLCWLAQGEICPVIGGGGSQAPAVRIGRPSLGGKAKEPALIQQVE